MARRSRAQSSASTLLAAPWATPATAAEDAPLDAVWVLDLDGAVGPASSDYLVRGIELGTKARARSPLSVLLRKKLRWTSQTLGPLLTPLAIRDGEVVVLGSDQRLYRMDATGERMWTAPRATHPTAPSTRAIP